MAKTKLARLWRVRPPLAGRVPPTLSFEARLPVGQALAKENPLGDLGALPMSRKGPFGLR